MGSSGGGGGQSGKVDYPAYIKDIHGLALTGDLSGGGAVTDTLSSSVTDLVNAATNPYTSASAFDPTAELAAMITELGLFSAEVDGVSPEANWSSFFSAALSVIETVDEGNEVEVEVVAFRDQVRDSLDGVVLPRFRGGMRDINAVMSSAFAVGESYIEASAERDVAKHLSELRLKLKARRDDLSVKAASDMIQLLVNKLELKKALSHYTIEAKRLDIVASKEQNDTDLAVDELTQKWPLDTLMYVGNMISAIAGASTTREGLTGPSTFRTAMGGAIGGIGLGLAAGATGGGLAAMGIGGLLSGLF